MSRSRSRRLSSAPPPACSACGSRTRGDEARRATGWEGALRPPGARLPDFTLHEPGRRAGDRGVAARAPGGRDVRVLDVQGHLPGAGAEHPRRARRPRPRRAGRRRVGRPGQRHAAARARVPARAVDDRPDGLPARHAARSSSRCGRRSGSRRRPRAATTPPTRCSSTPRAASASASPPPSSRQRPRGRPLQALGGSVRGSLLRRHLAPLPEGGHRRVRARPRRRAGATRTSSPRPARARRCSAWSWCGGRPPRARAHAQQRGADAVAARGAPVRLAVRRRAHGRAASRPSRSPA